MNTTQILIISFNESHLTLAPSVQQRALSNALAGHSDVCLVMLASQEGGPSIQNKSWDAALEACGYDQRVAESDIVSQNAVTVYARSGDKEVRMLDSFVTRSPNIEGKKIMDKGSAVVVVNCHGLKLCLGGCHLDGNLPGTAARLAQMPSAVLRSWARVGGIDVALFAGDMNCTVDPEKADAEDAHRGAALFSQLLASDVARLRETEKCKSVMELSPATRNALLTELSSAASRAALLDALDGCPPRVSVESSALQHDDAWTTSESPESKDEMAACTIEELCLQGMPQGSFPTYRLTNREGRGISSLKCHTLDEDGDLQPLNPQMDVPTECIEECYFADVKAGVLKKRGDMIRLNLGWLDRLYYGVSRTSGTPAAEVHVVPGKNLAMCAADSTMSDHAFSSWVVALKHPVDSTL